MKKRTVLTMVRGKKQPIYRDGLMHHHYRFGFRKNFKVWICRVFGHRINNEVKDKWCERCGLFYGEIYYKQENWAEHI